MRGLTVLYDESCGLCTVLAAWLARRPGILAAPIGSPEGALLLRDLSREERYRSVHVVDAVGRRHSAGAALPPLLRGLPGGSVAAAACVAFPGATERAYRLVARHRGLVSRLLLARDRSGSPGA